MRRKDDIEVNVEVPTADIMNIALFHDETGEEIATISGRSFPVPGVGDAVSIDKASSTNEEDLELDEGEGYRVADLLFQYVDVQETAESEGGVGANVHVFVIPAEEWEEDHED